MKAFLYCRKSSEAEDRQMLSIASQESELDRAFSAKSDIEIVDVFKEAASAKAPGRPIFNEMMDRIEQGHADSIIAWHPDRLARNSIDGGRIVYLLDRGRLKDLHFPTFTFENNPQGKFMLAITFGYSKYYVDNLSENVKRGNRAKIEQGWRPNMAPIGYLNDKDTKTIVPDPDHFPYVRKLFDLMLTGNHSVRRIVRIANDEWGYRTPVRKHRGGGPLPTNTLYRLLSNPFYAGYILWGGQLYPGKHEPVVSMAEFERVQELLGRPRAPKPKRRKFAYTGMISCGACGLAVTAEHKRNRFGSRYVYYHCTRKHRTPNCTQPSVEVRALEDQIRTYLHALTLPKSIHEWALEQLSTALSDRVKEQQLRLKQLDCSIRDIKTALSNLTDMRIRGLLDDDEFIQKRRTLQGELYKLQETRRSADQGESSLEPEKLLLTFSNRATSWFDSGDREVRRLILQSVSSNLTLEDKKLNIRAKNPFRIQPISASCHHLLANRYNVRTFPSPAARARLERITRYVHGSADKEELAKLVENIKALIQRCEPGFLEAAA